MARLLLRGARVVDPASDTDAGADVLVVDETIEDIGAEVSPGRAEILDCEGLVVAPGFVDLHTHLREPGREDAETVETGARAAALGGYTAICAMPNTEPVADTAAVILEVRNLADKAGLVDVHPAAAITKGLQGERLVEIGELAELGVRLFTDDHECVQSAQVMRMALEYARAFEVVICQHAQEATLTQGWQMHEGYFSSLLGLRGAPAEAEAVIVARDVLLAGRVGGRLHATHTSAGLSVDLIREAKARGIRVTADVTPHHLTFTDEDLQSYDTNLRVNPPLRSVEDREALRAGLVAGDLDAVATDHAPHAVEDKEVEFDQARPGTTGLETALGAVLAALGPDPDLGLVVERMSTGPARVLGLDEHGGPIAPGRPANLVAFDPQAEWTAGDRPWASRGRNSAFTGRTLRGRVVHTMLRGDLLVRDGEATR
ncbi:MAG TPA: dihydroorotase [Actinomycetota bacterium]|nr:dihydroorotase [Actinomycetota bacterium]